MCISNRLPGDARSRGHTENHRREGTSSGQAVRAQLCVGTVPCHINTGTGRSLGRSRSGIPSMCVAQRGGSGRRAGSAVNLPGDAEPAPSPAIHPPASRHARKQQKGVLRVPLTPSQAPSPASVYRPPSLAACSPGSKNQDRNPKFREAAGLNYIIRLRLVVLGTGSRTTCASLGNAPRTAPSGLTSLLRF